MANRFSSEVFDVLPKPIQKLMGEPSWWASVASFGVHGIIFAMLPFIALPTIRDESAEIQRQVTVIELGPGELNRVPIFSRSQLSIPDIPEGDDFYSFDDLGIPLNEIEEPEQYLSPLEPLPSFSLPQSFSFPPLPSPTPLPLPTPLPSPTPSTPTPLPPTSPPFDESPTNLDESTETNTNSSDEPDTNSSDETVQNSSEQVAVDSNDQELLESQWIAERLAEQEELRRLFTRTGEASDHVLAWTNEIKAADIPRGEPPIIEVTLDYPRTACPFIQQSMIEGENVSTAVGFVVKPDGQVGEQPGPKLVLESGIPFFDEQSVQLVTNSVESWENPPSTSQAYLMNITFVYTEESCPRGLYNGSQEETS